MARNTQFSRARSQRGGTFLGLVLGLIVGLAIAVVVAVYITKAPVPFVSRGGAQP
ncbi:MAG: SPOR domain-containing protein, partial [Ralstonia sp.]|nr:SPOR domain-containing protein [Ralstonia sp.]